MGRVGSTTTFPQLPHPNIAIPPSPIPSLLPKLRRPVRPSPFGGGAMPVAPEPSPSFSSSIHGGGGGGGGGKKMILSKYEVGKLLGCGAFAKVYHARHSATGNSVAIKCISKHKILKSGLSANINREISIMRLLRHPHIVRPLEVLASRHRIYFVMEFAKGGELFSRLASKGRLSEDLSRRYFRQLVSAVGYCHTRGVFHRDLKPENLLLDENGDLKVSDFGLSAVSDQLTADDGLFHTLCGTPAYVAPEILAKKGYDGAKVDVWSCGVILFVLVAGYLPFNDPNLMSMYRKIYRGDYRCPKWISPDLKRLLSRLLDTDPKTRISIDGILNDPWFNKGIADADRAELARFHHHEDASLKLVKEMEDRELNAFDIISFSSGFDLSGMFETSKRRERFACRATSEDAIARLEEEVARGGEGLEVKRRGEKGTGLVVEDASGFVLAAVEVYKLNRDMVVVELADSGRGSEALWERLRSTLDRLTRQTGLVAGS